MKNQPESPKDAPKGHLFINLKSIGTCSCCRGSVAFIWVLFKIRQLCGKQRSWFDSLHPLVVISSGIFITSLCTPQFSQK